MRKMSLLHQSHGIFASVLSDGFPEEQAFSYRLTKGKFGYNAARVITVSLARYLN